LLLGSKNLLCKDSMSMMCFPSLYSSPNHTCHKMSVPCMCYRQMRKYQRGTDYLWLILYLRDSSIPQGRVSVDYSLPQSYSSNPQCKDLMCL
jgi:hypothetical protein